MTSFHNINCTYIAKIWMHLYNKIIYFLGCRASASKKDVEQVYFRIKTKDLSKKLLQKLTLILLIFDDFGKILDFWPNFEFSEAHFGIFKIVGNRQTQTIFSSGRKIYVDYDSYP